MKIQRVVLATALLALLAPTAAAADGSGHLRDMLERVPDEATAGASLVSYVDYRAVESARPGAAQPGSTQEWLALRDSDGAAFGQWLAAMQGLVGGSGHLIQAFMAAGTDQHSMMGFDFFDVDRELGFGDPPGDGVVLSGTFHPQAIAAAHEARGFTATEVADGMLICGAAGCDQGLKVDLQAVERADPFGGFIGRQQPLFASDETLLSSAALETLQGMLAASDVSVPSLADDAAVGVALAAIPDDVLLRQAMLVPSALLKVDGGVEQTDGASLDLLPPHRMVMLADSATSDEQLAQVILVYGSEEDAQAAAAVLPGRVDVVRSFRADSPLRELFEARGMTSISTHVQADPAGAGAAMVLTLRSPLMSPDPREASSLLYRLIVDMVLTRDAAWLAPSVPSELSGARS